MGPLPLLLLLLIPAVASFGGPAPEEGQVLDLASYPWFYLRDDRPLGSAERPVEVWVVGDLMPGRGVAAQPYPLSEVAPLLGSADLALGNLEGVIALRGEIPPTGLEGHEISSSLAEVIDSSPDPIPLLIPPGMVSSLVRAGFDVLGMANNHALDLGSDRLEAASLHLQSAGFRVPGAGPHPRVAWEPALFPVRDLTVALLACNAILWPDDRALDGWAPAPCDPDLAEAAIQSARARAQAVIVSVHWGYEYDRRVDPAQELLAERLLEAGADLVIGHHPHVIQGTRVVPPDPDNPGRRDRFVAFSLGNFLFDQAGGYTEQGLVLRVFFDREGLRAVQALPIRAGVRPRLLALEETTEFLAQAAPPLRHLAFTCDRETCQEAYPAADRGPALTGPARVDLTGDGTPEQVIRTQNRAHIFQGGEKVWTSPDSWQVVDLAAGDPNDDGRGEVLLALEKPDDGGVMRSHPFIVGHRGGRYRVLWGGSALSARLEEVALGDLDGDGRQELVTLEESGQPGLRRLGVWDWHGWGFSLRWQGPEGPYSSVYIVSGKQGEPARLQLTSEYLIPPAR